MYIAIPDWAKIHTYNRIEIPLIMGLQWLQIFYSESMYGEQSVREW